MYYGCSFADTNRRDFHSKHSGNLVAPKLFSLFLNAFFLSSGSSMIGLKCFQIIRVHSAYSTSSGNGFRVDFYGNSSKNA